MDPEQAKKSYATDEVALRAKQLYEHEIRERVEPEHSGRYLVVDVESGDYEIANEALVATRALRGRRPAAVTYLMRVGRLAAYRLGGCILTVRP
ncbi:MAG TPA: hypothetical protein VE288_11345 [Rubrobacteraceae bacterium]|jgi:hypothetical protein|nr:hypothetical protein [Rubrobacteraceae bacterium]